MMLQLLHNTAPFLVLLLVVAMTVLLFGRGRGGFSWSLTRHGRLAQWSHARKIAQVEEKMRRAFKSHGTVTNVRNHPEDSSSFLDGLQGHTELETTQGMLIVDDIVGPISRGLAVYVNQNGQVRIGGLYSRTFALRVEKQPAPAAVVPECIEAVRTAH